MRRAWAAAVLLSLAAAACTPNPATAPPRSTATPPGTPGSSPTPLASPSPPSFDVRHVVAHTRMLAQTIGTREATSRGYARAADYVAGRLASYGYRVSRQAVAVPAGSSEGVPVPAGTSHNVIATPPGFVPERPHIVAGAHLDTVVPAPGANDNASGVALMLELALLAARAGTATPVVFVAFTGEERRVKGPDGALYGSKRYVASRGRAERQAIAGMLNLDMIANGPVTLVCRGSRVSSRRFIDAVLSRAKVLGVPARENVVTQFFSDYGPFERAGIPVAWLWSGEHPTVHTPKDTMSVVVEADLARTGRLAWETIRAYS